MNKEQEFNKNSNNYIKLFTEDKIQLFREYLLNTFKQANLNDFKDEANFDRMLGTMGWRNCLDKLFKNSEKNFLKWYDSLEWYQSDEFDAKIRKLLVIKGD